MTRSGGTAGAGTNGIPGSGTSGTGVIVDNMRRRVGDVLREGMEEGSLLSVVSAYFTIYGFDVLRDALEKVSRTRFLYGEPRSVGELDPVEADPKAFSLTDDGGIDLKKALAQKPLARDCAKWIEKHVDVRTIKQANFLHGKLYHIARGDRDGTALAGSSNLTRRGLGFGGIPNIELNLDVTTAADRDALLAWFDELWRDKSRTRDVKQQVLDALERIGRPYAPQFVYYKTLFHVFEQWLAERGARDGLLHDIHLYDTAIWSRLYDFQKDGATNAINRLLRHNGCIIADSVGLGKTWTALAVIKFFELRNERVLVLCPKRLADNWERYASWAGQMNNPFAQDRLNYTVLAHTDLSRCSGRSGSIDLANFNWGAFDLVVIDESHNFRNEGRDQTDEAGETIRRSRYNRLLEDVLKDSVRSKVLMLSATPVNTSLRDLRNQIYLMTEKRQDAFREALGIGDLQSLFGVAQHKFQQWEQQRRLGKADKNALIERLGAGFLALLDAVTIARSRTHIQRYYPQVEEEIGGFPERATPENLHPPSDLKGELSYDDLHERIGAFRLAVYNPSLYVEDTAALDREKEESRFDQRDRERWLIGMVRVNLLKRLESSVHSFTVSMERILEKVEGLDQRISSWLESPAAAQESRTGDGPDEDEEDEEFVVGRKRRRYSFAELDIERWQADLREDIRTLRGIHRAAQQVTVERDAKLAELRKALNDKIANPAEDKDGRPNRKALVFTSFADTAHYLYEHLVDTGLGVHMAVVTGGSGNRSGAGSTKFNEILERFAPRAQERRVGGEEIDILIATDCLSEGQNLQDCDLVVNYDIHWNPVRLMQRFGRIDRLGSRNRRVSMTNFWPTRNLDRYLDLKNRVEARMALADATATGRDDPLAEQDGGAVQGELTFRDEQLKRLRSETLDIEEAGDGISLSDLTLDDFIADLLRYVQQNRADLEAAPTGIYAVVDDGPAPDGTSAIGVRPGVIFCLKHRSDPPTRTPNLLQPYYLVHVRADGTVRYTFRQAGQCLTLFRDLAAERTHPSSALEEAFDSETGQGRRMEKCEILLAAALRDIGATFRGAERRALGRDRGARITRRSEGPNDARDFELITWLVIADRQQQVDRSQRQSSRPKKRQPDGVEATDA